MNRFVEYFFEYETSKLINEINAYAKRNGLQIISLSTNDDLHGAIVLFEGNAKYGW